MITSCRECNGKVASDARSCPHCGTGSPTGVPDSTPRIERDLDVIKRKLGALRLIGQIFLVIVFLYFGHDLLMYLYKLFLHPRHD